MCDWCKQHGDGKKWYLNIKNYSEDLLNDQAVSEAANAYFQNIESVTQRRMGPPDVLNLENNDDFTQYVESMQKAVGTNIPHRGQVVPVEDVKEIITLSSPIARIACVCRRAVRASFDEKTCIALGPIFLEYAKEWPDYTRGGIDYISKEETVELMEGFNRKGYVATIWRLFDSPAVVGFCNCEFPTCGALRGRRYYGDWYNFFLRKAEYVAMEDFDKCNGCRVCASRCQFGAITYSPYLEKAIINMKKCAGCGLCRDTCPQNAIELVLRAEFAAVEELW
ncbi:MAG: ATP-binding protein [Candidatus Bathyarchaeia archaeon]